MFAAVSSEIAEDGKQRKRPSVGEWIDKLLYAIGEKANCRESKQICGCQESQIRAQELSRWSTDF